MRLLKSFRWVIRVFSHDKGTSCGKAFNVACDDVVDESNALSHSSLCAIHMYIKGMIIPVNMSMLPLISPTYCHSKLMNNSSIRKTAVDIAWKLIARTTICRPAPTNYIDKWQLPKIRVGAWVLSAWRARSEQAKNCCGRRAIVLKNFRGQTVTN